MQYKQWKIQQLTCTNAATGGDTSITSLELSAGLIIYGTFHTISCAAGKSNCLYRIVC